MSKLKLHHLIIILILALSFFFRVYRIDALLRFYYDQGRDALVIKEMIEKPKPILIGPTTGLAGIFRGPAYYYLVAPGYLIGGGNPVVAAIWLQAINVIGLVFIYLAAKELFSVRAGIIALLFFGLSHEVVSLSRWLSNPSPILTSVPIMLYALARVIKKGNPKWWYVIALMLGLNLQFEMASEIWFIPALFVALLLQKIKLPHPKIILKSSAIFLATFLPQVIFDIRHDGIIRKGIQTYFSGEGKSFSYDPKIFLDRVFLYLDGFADLIKGRNFALSLASFILILSLPFYLTKDKKNLLWPIYILLFFPLTLLLFYVGNDGNFFKYYLIGLFPIFILLLAISLDHVLHSAKKTALIAIIFISFFLKTNITLLKTNLSAGIDGYSHISIGNQLQGIDWIYQQAAGKPFNVDFYVPPVIPYAYYYLVPWYGKSHYQKEPTEELVELLFTLYEVDPIQPDNFAAWQKRQDGIGIITDEVKFGGIYVQKRKRLSKTQAINHYSQLQ